MLAQPENQSEALRRLLAAVEKQMERIFLRFRIPSQDAEDILQDSLLAFLNHRDNVHNPEAWLIGTLRNRCFLYWRARRRQLWEAVDSSLLVALAGETEPNQNGCAVRRDLSTAIRRLPKRCQSILHLRYGLDCDNAEVAERLGYHTSSIRQITTRCIAALTVKLVEGGYRDEGTEHGERRSSVG